MTLIKHFQMMCKIYQTRGYWKFVAIHCFLRELFVKNRDGPIRPPYKCEEKASGRFLSLFWWYKIGHVRSCLISLWWQKENNVCGWLDVKEHMTLLTRNKKCWQKTTCGWIEVTDWLTVSSRANIGIVCGIIRHQGVIAMLAVWPMSIELFDGSQDQSRVID